MRAVKHFLIEAKDTHKEKTKGGLILVTNFENQDKANQVYKIHSVPNKFKDVANKGDLLLVHFNVVVFELNNGKRVPSNNHVMGDIYHVPYNMLHAVLDPVTYEVKHLFEEWNVIDPIIDNEDKKTETGIIFELKKTEFKLKQDFMYGRVIKANAVESGKKVMLTEYSDYSVEFPNGETYWLVMDSQILGEYED